MRKALLVIAVGVVLSWLQVSWLNLSGTAWTWNLPLVAIVFAALTIRIEWALLLTVITTVSLDYVSVLPFGSYLLVGCACAVTVWYAAQRLPLRQHQAWQLVTIAGVSALSVLLLLALSTLLSSLRLAQWTFFLNTPMLVSVLVSTITLNVLIALIWLGLRLMLRRFVQGRLFVYGR